MAVTITWNIRANLIPTMTVGPDTFTDVVHTVHWRCTAEESGDEAAVYGTVILDLPTSIETYIDLTELTGKTEIERRAIVLGWAEIVRPGFVAVQAARATAMLAQMIEEQVSPTLVVL